MDNTETLPEKPAPDVQEPKEKKPKAKLFKDQNTLIIILLVVLFSLFGLILVLSFFRPKSSPSLEQPVVYVSPSSVLSSPITRPVSEFAQSQRFQEYEKTLNKLKQDNQEVDLNEPQLSFPLLDMDVSF